MVTCLYMYMYSHEKVFNSLIMTKMWEQLLTLVAIHTCTCVDVLIFFLHCHHRFLFNNNCLIYVTCTKVKSFARSFCAVVLRLKIQCFLIMQRK